MTFPEFWHLLTTSRYTRLLERENAELREQVEQLRQALAAKRTVVYEGETSEQREGTPRTNAIQRPRRPGRFQGFSQIKRDLEAREAPSKGA